MRLARCPWGDPTCGLHRRCHPTWAFRWQRGRGRTVGFQRPRHICEPAISLPPARNAQHLNRPESAAAATNDADDRRAAGTKLRARLRLPSAPLSPPPRCAPRCAVPCRAAGRVAARARLSRRLGSGRPPPASPPAPPGPAASFPPSHPPSLPPRPPGAHGRGAGTRPRAPARPRTHTRTHIHTHSHTHTRAPSVPAPSSPPAASPASSSSFLCDETERGSEGNGARRYLFSGSALPDGHPRPPRPFPPPLAVCLQVAKL